MQKKFDEVTLSVIQNGLVQVCNEMDLAFQSSAFSPVISEAMDRSDGIYHRDTGDLIAQGEWGMPIWVGCMQFSTQAGLAYIRKHKMPVQPGAGFIFRYTDKLRVDLDYLYSRAYAGLTTEKQNISLKAKYSMSDLVDLNIQLSQEISRSPDYRLTDLTANVEMKL